KEACHLHPVGTHTLSFLLRILGKGILAGKVGTCPENTEVLPASANCTTECQSDAGCEGNAKCCSMGCSKVCRIPDGNASLAHTHSCTHTLAGNLSSPRIQSQLVGSCRIIQHMPKRFPMHWWLKCCTNGCGKKSCSAPVV
uniref:WAP domain-containing protein n=1 Tax=Anolis carolinensis TaxID=28377 RepID=A0A803T715_ANOCA